MIMTALQLGSWAAVEWVYGRTADPSQRHLVSLIIIRIMGVCTLLDGLLLIVFGLTSS